jgi:hypothetical protein
VKFWVIACMILQSICFGPALAQATSGGGAASGGSLGSSGASPGTNSAGTAAPSGGSRTGASVATGTGDRATDREDRQVGKKVKSICKGC